MAQVAQDFEMPPVLRASEVLPGVSLVGPNYRIEASVHNDGYKNRYSLTTPYGPLTVEGTDMLMIRLKELKAIQHMEELKLTKAYGDAFKNAAKGPLRTAKELVTNPLDTAKGTVTGVHKWFDNIGHSVLGKGSKEEEGTIKTILGFDSVKRKFAYEFGVDPYSSNEPLQERLNEISWAAFAGGMTVRVAFTAIPGAAGLAVSGSGFVDGMNKLVRDKTPAELKELNEGKLKAMGVHESLADVFLEHPKYSPSKKTYLVGALDRMGGVGGRDVLIREASLVEEESVAFFTQRRAEMLAGYHVNIAPVARLVRVVNASFAQRKDGTIIGVFPLDHVPWTRSVSRNVTVAVRAINKLPNFTGVELWLAGTVSPLARRNLEAMGFRVKENTEEKLSLK